jgi:hypothetical protein
MRIKSKNHLVCKNGQVCKNQNRNNQDYKNQDLNNKIKIYNHYIIIFLFYDIFTFYQILQLYLNPNFLKTVFKGGGLNTKNQKLPFIYSSQFLTK